MTTVTRASPSGDRINLFSVLRGRKNMLISLASVAMTLVGYHLISSSRLLPWYFLPPLSDVYNQFVTLIFEPYANATLQEHLFISIERLLVSFAISVALAIPLGLAAGMNKWCQAVLYPIVEYIRPISAVAFIPLLILWFGIGETSKLLALLKAGFFPMFLNIVAGVKSADKTMINAAYTLGANKRQVALEVIFPGTVPYIAAGMRIGLGLMWATIITAELIAAQTGIGHLIFMAREWIQTDIVILGVIVIAIVSIMLDKGIRTVEARMTRWQETPLR